MEFGKRKAALLLASLGLTVGAGLAANVGPASADAQICAQSGTGYCLNNWNAAGGAVKMGQSGWPNQTFANVQETGACNAGKVSSAMTCPFSNQALDDALNGEPIEYLQYTGSGTGHGECVGLASSTSTSAILVTCPNSAGNGGGWGVTYVQDNGTCTTHLDNVRATATGGTSTPWNLRSGGATGSQAIMSTARDGTTCWG
jgi:hypothetical protein